MYKRKSSPTSFSHADRLCDQLRVEQQQSNLLAAKTFLETSLNTKLCEDLHKELQDGVVLCRLINCMKPGTISSIGRKNIPFVKMANISLFLQGAKDLGLQNSDLFQTVDLYEAKDMTAVINTILTFARICNKDTKSTESFGNNQKQNRRQPSTSTTSHQRQHQQQQQQHFHSTHRHVKNIFEQQQHLSPDMIGHHHQALQPKDIDSMNTGGMDTKLEGLRHTYKHLTQKSALGGTGYSKQQLPMTNDSGYGSLTRQRQTSNSTPTQIIDALFDDENEGNEYSLHEGEMGSSDQQQTSSHLQVHGGPCIIRKRFSQTSLNMDSSSSSSSSPSPSPRRPTLPTKIDSESVIDNTPTLPPYPVPSQSTPPVSQHTLSASPLPLLPKKKKESLSSSSTTAATAATNASSLFGRTSSSSCPRKQHRTMGLDSNEKQARRISSPTIGTATITSNTIDRNSSVGIKDQRRLTVRISLKKRGNPTKRSTHFLLGDCVGKGQFGSVYRALDMQTGEIVAVKRISVEDTKVEDDIMQEINLLRGMTCPHIVRYIGFAQDDTYMNIVLEYVENGSLLSTLKAFGSLPEKLVGCYTYKILKGLEYLHSHDVVHCDLKAANILTTKTGDIKLTDFGVSLNLKIKQEDGKGTPAGTPNWMAPEVIEMKGACYKSDIWSLACTITELLTGKPPYADLISMSALYHIVEDDCPPLPANISNNLRDFLLLCFRKDPVRRPTASDLLHHPWLQSIKYDTTQPASPIEAPQQPCLHNSDEKMGATVDGDVNDSLEMTAGNLMDQQQLRNNNVDETDVDTDTEMESDDDANSQVTILTCDNNFLDLIGKPGQHVFTKTRLENHTVCEVCRQNSLYYAYICEVCAFVCHETCRPKAALCFYSRKKMNKVSQDDDRMPPWVSSVSPFGVTTFEPSMPSHALIPTRPNFPKQASSSNSNKLQRFFGFRRKPQQPSEQKKTNTTTGKPVYGILKAAKSVPLLRESQRKMLDEHSRASVHPQLNYYDDSDISYPLSPSPSTAAVPSSPSPLSPASPPLPTNIIYRKKRRQASSSMTPPLPPTAWKIAPASLNNMEQRQKRRTKSLQADKDCIIS